MNAEMLSPESQAMAGGEPLLPPVGKLDAHAPSFLQQIYQFLSVGALAVASYFVISHFVLQTVQVAGVSMVPTLHDSERYFLNRWIYHVRAPQRGDVVVIRDPTDGGLSVKRIIGVEGDAVYLKDGDVFRNGRKLSEPYLASGTPTYPYDKLHDQLLVCGKSQFLVLGDNRTKSADSRAYGVISRERILGLLIR